jgi:pimeloyl-ACP methyl ester carboxylesterase
MRSIWGNPGLLLDEDLDHYWQLIQHNQGMHLFHSTIYYMTERKQYRPRWIQAMARSIVPLAVINGSLDPISGSHMVDRYRELIGDSSIYTMDLCGHYPHLEDPDGVAAYYQQFLLSRLGIGKTKTSLKAGAVKAQPQKTLTDDQGSSEEVIES